MESGPSANNPGKKQGPQRSAGLVFTYLDALRDEDLRTAIGCLTLFR